MNIKTFALALVAPYGVATAILSGASIGTWQALRSDRARDAYRTFSIVIQVSGWLAFLACLYTLQAGRAARRYYEAEWASEVGALALRIDRALSPLGGGATLPQADDLPQVPCAPAPAHSIDQAVALDAAASIQADQVQAILSGKGTTTNRLRALANLGGIPWRHSRGRGKHMSNGDIRRALAPLIAPDLLAQIP